MCGIFGYLGKKNSIQQCLQGLKLLEYRGYDSAGIAAIKNGKLIYYRASGKIAVLEKKINLKDLPLSLAIGHTRWATHGAAIEKNAHPHLDHKNNLALVHNGIIENYEVLKKDLISKGIKFKSQTDTEVIAQLISLNYVDDLQEATKKTLKMLKGSFAIVVIHKKHENEMVAAARECPLAIGYDDQKDEIIVSSDPNAFLGRNLNVIFLKNDEIAYIKNKEILVFDINHNIVDKKIEKLNSKSISFSKNGYDHFMLKEIYDQSITIQQAYLGRITAENTKVEFDSLTLDENYLSSINHIIITACGTSYHAALIASSFLQDHASILTTCEISSEFRFKNILITPNTLVIAISQSGETADTISAIKAAKDKGAKILSIINVKNSSISRISDSSIFLNAGPELSVCSTKAFTSQITVLYLFTMFMANLRKTKDGTIQNFLTELKKVPIQIKKILKNADAIKEKAAKYSKYDSFFFLGRNLMYPTAMEAALKLKEISYLNANAYPAGEMKHGPLALINSKLPVIAFCSNIKTYDKMLSNIMEAKTRNAPILAFATKDSPGIESIADDIIWLEPTIDELSIFQASVAGQLFAYYIAKMRNTDIDHPRNLAKSVTVE
ncbi:MAG: glutamine--fructose-6-phosphate transaminase (isomerizing) [Parachlamydiales bacterium]|jgi:glucosamine--fructose-6-phosphate aminotransferase (isomerizing)